MPEALESLLERSPTMRQKETHLLIMRRAIISDIHGNQHALEAVLRDMEKEVVENVVCLGDIVGYGAFPNECLDLVRRHCEVVVKGNHDAMAGSDEDLEGYYEDARVSLEWTREKLSEEERAYLHHLPMVLKIKSATFVHASLYDSENWPYLEYASEIEDHFQYQDSHTCFFGHTHVPGLYNLDNPSGYELSWNTPVQLPEDRAFLLNVGSVGQPRDNDPRACYLIFDELQGVVTFKRVRYEIARAQTGIRAVKMPKFLADRLAEGV